MLNEILNEPYTWIIGSFIVFAGVAWMFGRPALIRALDDKITQIRVEVENAERLKREAAEMLADYQDRAAHASTEAAQIIATARDHADTFRLHEEDRLNEMMARKERQLAESIALLRDQAIAELRDTAVDLAARATAQLVHQKMDDETRARLIDRALTQISGRLAG